MEEWYNSGVVDFNNGNTPKLKFIVVMPVQSKQQPRKATVNVCSNVVYVGCLLYF